MRVDSARLGADRPRCQYCGRVIEPCRSMHEGGFMHSDDRRETGADGHLATLAHFWRAAP